MTQLETAKPWERQDGESCKRFAAFLAYRDLPAHARSLDAAYRSDRQLPKGARAPGWWRQWSERNRWVERVAAYDDHLAKLGQAAAEARAIELARRRVDFEFDQQLRIEAAVEDLWSKLPQYKQLPPTTVKRTEKTVDPETGKTTGVQTTVVTGLRPSELIRFVEGLVEIIGVGVNGHVRKSLSGRIEDPAAGGKSGAMPGDPVEVVFVDGEVEEDPS